MPQPGSETAKWDAVTPCDLDHILKDIPAHWYIVGGWALDLWRGHQTRPHEDLEFCTLATGVAIFRNALPDYEWVAAQSGHLTPLGPTDPAPEGCMQFWAKRLSTGLYAFDMMIEPGTCSTWHYKRDNGLSAPRAQMIRTTKEGIPYLSPAAVLLFKAKHQRPKDESDFNAALPHLTQTDRHWIKSGLLRLYPNHDWLKAL